MTRGELGDKKNRSTGKLIKFLIQRPKIKIK